MYIFIDISTNTGHFKQKLYTFSPINKNKGNALNRIQ